jgi:rhodanese-related sulfurtransferase
MAHLETIDPVRAAALVRDGAVLVDVREAYEHAAEHIPGARHVALSTIDRAHPMQPGDSVLIFHCKSGARTNVNAPRLAAAACGCKAYLLGGGIDAWRQAGLPTSRVAQGAVGAERGFLRRLFG